MSIRSSEGKHAYGWFVIFVLGALILMIAFIVVVHHYIVLLNGPDHGPKRFDDETQVGEKISP
jgi:hypothetical protein